MGIIPEPADIFHYFLPDGNPINKIEQYKMTLDDFVNLKVGFRPQNAELVRKFQYDFSALEKQEYLRFSNKLNWMQRLLYAMQPSL